MRALIQSVIAVATLTSAMGLAHAAPVELSADELDQVSAGGQYSVVSGGGSADKGTVTVLARSFAKEKPNGATKTKAVLRVKAVGSGLEAYGAGESGAGGAVSGVAGYGAVDQGKVVIRVKTMSKVKKNGDVITKSSVKVRTVEKGNASTVTRAAASF